MGGVQRTLQACSARGPTQPSPRGPSSCALCRGDNWVGCERELWRSRTPGREVTVRMGEGQLEGSLSACPGVPEAGSEWGLSLS